MYTAGTSRRKGRRKPNHFASDAWQSARRQAEAAWFPVASAPSSQPSVGGPSTQPIMAWPSFRSWQRVTLTDSTKIKRCPSNGGQKEKKEDGH